MMPAQIKTAPFAAQFFPLNLALLTVGENMMPMGYWTLISKDPFRMMISMGVGNHSLTLLKKYKEAALHFMPWSERERVVRAGYMSGRDVNKAELLGYSLHPAEKLQHTRLVDGADAVLEMVIYRELTNLSREFAPHVMDVVAVHSAANMFDREPILYLSQEEFATQGERWTFRK